MRLLNERKIPRISIHTPLAGSDESGVRVMDTTKISIHTPLAGSDHAVEGERAQRFDFNPHSPCGERPGPRLRMRRR